MIPPVLGDYCKLASLLTEPRPLGSGFSSLDKRRFPLLPTYEHVLKCSHLFNTLDSRAAIARVRKVAVGVAEAWMDQHGADAATGRHGDAAANEPAEAVQ